MVQVEEINSCGTYCIPDLEVTQGSKHDNVGVKLTPENLVRLVVPGGNDRNQEEKIYSLEEIKDIQSKLALIAGKGDSGKEEVDHFNQVSGHD